MPLLTVEQNRIANDFTSSTWTCYLHTANPTDASPTNGRTSVGGGAYEAGGRTVPAADFSVASNGDVQVTDDIDFGTADEAVGTVIAMSFYRSGAPVGWVTLPSTVIGDGDGFLINANSLQLNGSST